MTVGDGVPSRPPQASNGCCRGQRTQGPSRVIRGRWSTVCVYTVGMSFASDPSSSAAAARAAVTGTLQPIHLLADSQLLFRRGPSGSTIWDSVRASRAAYIGASNGDLPEFYSIFEAAMDVAAVPDRRMICAAFDSGDQDFLRHADLIVLAGGDLERGWKVIVETGMREQIANRYAQGAALIGISAGAIQLGAHAVLQRAAGSQELGIMLGLVPFIVDVHDEAQDWAQLAGAIELLEGAARGIGIPRGAGLVSHPNGAIEALRHAACEFTFEERALRRALLLPVTDST
jgi:cyanophycinase